MKQVEMVINTQPSSDLGTYIEEWLQVRGLEETGDWRETREGGKRKPETGLETESGTGASGDRAKGGWVLECSADHEQRVDGCWSAVLTTSKGWMGAGVQR